MVKDNILEVIHEMEEVTKLFKLEPFDIYIIIVSKIIRLAQKDIEDLNQIASNCDKTLLNNIIREILEREDLFESKKKEFEKKLKIFKEMYDV